MKHFWRVLCATLNSFNTVLRWDLPGSVTRVLIKGIKEDNPSFKRKNNLLDFSLAQSKCSIKSWVAMSSQLYTYVLFLFLCSQRYLFRLSYYGGVWGMRVCGWMSVMCACMCMYVCICKQVCVDARGWCQVSSLIGLQGFSVEPRAHWLT